MYSTYFNFICTVKTQTYFILYKKFLMCKQGLQKTLDNMTSDYVYYCPRGKPPLLNNRVRSVYIHTCKTD